MLLGGIAMRTYSLPVVALAGSLVLPQFLFPPAASAQSVISARSGLINYFEGVVFLDGQPLEKKPGLFPRMKQGSTLLTESGRAEVLLTPDAYLRMGEGGSIRMLSNSISDTQVEIISGSAILDNSRAPDGDFVKLVFKDSTIRIMKPGHYRIDAEPPQLRVYTGQAEVTKNSGVPGSASHDARPVTIQASQLFALDGAPVVKRFTEGSDGLLDLWSDERDSLIASNMASAQSITDPLLDSGPDVPADLAAYIGYVPLPPAAGPNAPGALSTAPSAAYDPYGSYGYGYGLPSLYPGMPVGFYPGLAIAAFVPLPMNTGIYARGLYQLGRPYGVPAVIGVGSGITSGFSIRSIYGTTGIGTLTSPRSIYTPRPASPVIIPRVGGGIGAIRGIGGIHAVGRR